MRRHAADLSVMGAAVIMAIHGIWESQSLLAGSGVVLAFTMVRVIVQEDLIRSLKQLEEINDLFFQQAATYVSGVQEHQRQLESIAADRIAATADFDDETPS